MYSTSSSQPHPPRRVVAEALAVADVAADHLGGAVASLGHDVALLDAGGGRAGGQSGAQAVAGEQLRVQARLLRVVLDDQRYGLCGEPLRFDLPVAVDRAE